VLHGNPAGDELWQALADYVNAVRFTNAHGKELISEACAIDTGGHYTHAVYMDTGAANTPFSAWVRVWPTLRRCVKTILTRPFSVAGD
jgi:phage terminase large subunit GpA-like protein